MTIIEKLEFDDTEDMKFWKAFNNSRSRLEEFGFSNIGSKAIIVSVLNEIKQKPFIVALREDKSLRQGVENPGIFFYDAILSNGEEIKVKNRFSQMTPTTIY